MLAKQWGGETLDHLFRLLKSSKPPSWCMSLMGAHLHPAVSARRVPLPLSFRQVQCSFSTTRLIRVVLGSPGNCAPVSEPQPYVRSTVYHFAQHELRELGSSWLCHVPHSHRLSLAELQLHPRPYKQGLASSTVGFQVDQYLTWLRQRLKTVRTEIVQHAKLACACDMPCDDLRADTALSRWKSGSGCKSAQIARDQRCRAGVASVAPSCCCAGYDLVVPSC